MYTQWWDATLFVFVHILTAECTPVAQSVIYDFLVKMQPSDYSDAAIA